MEPPPPLAADGVRVLTRQSRPIPTTAKATAISSDSSHPLQTTGNAPSAAAAAPVEGVVVVGVMSSRHAAEADAENLINRILDAHVFGSGSIAGDLLEGLRQEVGVACKDWLWRRRIAYHHDPERKVVYLHFSLPPPIRPSSSPVTDAAVADVNDLDSCDLRAMLFVFSVSHVIILLNDGLQFDTQLLKKFRLLQSAKHALVSFVRPQAAASSANAGTRVQSSSPRRKGAFGRQSPSMSLLSATTSLPSVLPGQCTPVILFVFEDDLFDVLNPSIGAEEAVEASLVNQASTSDSVLKSSPMLKGSGPVVMLARPASRSENSLRKKIHSSLEAQVRFLVKKWRMLDVTESRQFGSSRGAAGHVNHLPLFSLDASRAVTILDRSMNQRGESLDCITGLIEDCPSSNSMLDLPALERSHYPFNNEDIQMIKDFISRQSDLLRGRGGVSSSTSGPVAGVGMLAMAAAAAAASAASGKPINAPELPSFNRWLSVSTSILTALLSEDGLLPHDDEKSEETGNEKQNQLSSQRSASIRATISCLEAGSGVNMKFSTVWCQRAISDAKEMYLEDLPLIYPTKVHEEKLHKALRSFNSMVRGPAVRVFLKILEDECQSIWESGRQQCDAVSLTGNPCAHQRHDTSSSLDPEKEHSSGYVFLHACACGRLRRLRDDPFDFESANLSFNCFSNCEDLLPTFAFAKGKSCSHMEMSWRLMRLGDVKYYDPVKGLLQNGFCSNEKHLMRWLISVERRNVKTEAHGGVSTKHAATVSPQSSVNAAATTEMNSAVTVSKSSKSENLGLKPKVEAVQNPAISFGKGLPNFTMKKPFAEVVAGITRKDAEFPALQRSQPKHAYRKDERKIGGLEQWNGVVAETVNQAPRSEIISGKARMAENNRDTGEKPFLEIGSNLVPVNLRTEGTESTVHYQQYLAYVGFEHECPYGHRFLLSEQHLKEFESSFLLHGRSPGADNQFENAYGLSEKLPPNAGEQLTAMPNRNATKISSPIETSGRSYQQHVSISMKKNHVNAEKVKLTRRVVASTENETSSRKNRHNAKFSGEALSLLNRNLPIYMRCPHCKSSDKQDQGKTKFSSRISQLQRIFIVTPDFPVLLATHLTVRFEDTSLPASVSDREQQSCFSVGCPVFLPPESFLCLRLPFVYGVRLDDGNIHPLRHFEHQPEHTAWLVGGTALQLVSVGHQGEETASTL